MVRANVINEFDFPHTSWQEPHKHFTAVTQHAWYKAILALSGQIVYSSFDFFRHLNYVPALAPITCQSVSSPMGLGSDSVPVQIDLFDEPTYLADSMQFQLEYLLRQTEHGVFYVMPTFRGEDADARHLNQFFHIEAEMKGDLSVVMNVVSQYLFFITNAILENIDACNISWLDVSHLQAFVAQKKLESISFNQTQQLLTLSPRHYQFLNDEPIGLTNEGEQTLLRHYPNGVWLTHLPAIGVPFYQADYDEKYALCADFLLGIGEIVGCGHRHTSHEATYAACQRRQVDPNQYQWYLKLKKEYPLQTSGFGMGLERYLLWILKHNDIRDIPLFNRIKGFNNGPYLP